MFWNRSGIQNPKATVLSISSQQTTSLRDLVFCTVQYQQQQQGPDVPRCATARESCLPKLTNFVVSLLPCAGRHLFGLHYSSITLRWLHARAGDVQQQAPIERPWSSPNTPPSIPDPRPALGKLQATLVSASQPLRLSLSRPMSFGLLPSSPQISPLGNRPITRIPTTDRENGSN